MVDQANTIPQETYFNILSKIPVVCIDNIAFRIQDGEPNVLLLKRLQDPAKDCLYPIGKGLRKNEVSKDWALEVVFKETNLKSQTLNMFGVYEVIYDVAQNVRVSKGLHNVCFGYLTRLEEGKVKIDDEHSDFRWIRKEEFEGGLILPPYTRTLIEDSRIFSRDVADLTNPRRTVHRILDYRGVDFSKFRSS